MNAEKLVRFLLETFVRDLHKMKQSEYEDFLRHFKAVACETDDPHFYCDMLEDVEACEALRRDREVSGG